MNLCKLCLAIVIGAYCLRSESHICSCSLEEQKKIEKSKKVLVFISFYIKFNPLLKSILVRVTFSIVYGARNKNKKKRKRKLVAKSCVERYVLILFYIFMQQAGSSFRPNIILSLFLEIRILSKFLFFKGHSITKT